MLHVVCGRCGQSFEAADDAVETEDVCPYCGAALDGEESDPTIEFQPARPFDPIRDSQAAPRGIPSPLWWLIAAAAVGVFVYGTVAMLRGDDWERQHVQALADADRKAAALMYAGDFMQAANVYESIVTELSGRDIQSIYLRQLLDQASQGAAEARRRMALAAAHPQAATAPAATEAAPISEHDAIVSFQRKAESFPQYVRSRPMLFQDSQGNWRRRQFVVWDVDAQQAPDSDPAKMDLKYTCNSRTTAAYADREEAKTDFNFQFDEHIQAIHCSAEYELRDGKWVAADRDSDLLAQDNSAISDGTVRPETILDLSELRKMETEHFSGSR